MEESLHLKVILLGNSGVGKTSFVNASHQVSIENITSSTGMSFSTYEYFDTGITLNIWDTAGQEVYHNLVKSYFRGSHIVIFFTACNDPSKPNAKEKNDKDDEELFYWIDQAYDCLGDTFTPVFVLNKIDFYKDDAEKLIKRQDEVRDKIIKQRPELENSLVLYPISCIDNLGVKDLIESLGTIAEKILEDQKDKEDKEENKDGSGKITLNGDSQQNNTKKCSC